MSPRTSCLTVFIAAWTSLIAAGQVTDTSSVTMRSRLSFYSFEDFAEVLISLPSPLYGAYLDISLKSGDSTLVRRSGREHGNPARIPFTISRNGRTTRINAEITAPGNANIRYTARCDLTVLPYKPNEVKADRLTGGLIVNRLPFFPVGFYCYSPVHPLLPEEEAVKGFNLISPYQKILPETFSERKSYMDRCAQLGMKVHYNLISVSGGGGVNSDMKGFSDDQKRELLLNEIKAFMDHPALLAWYIADEPNGTGTPPETIEEIYRTVKNTDPWHPVSVVFMTPFTTAVKYAKGLDIVMADPYPIPVYPVTMAGNAAAALRKEFSGKNPVWIVPQAFGGGEHWRREPTAAEIRSMTWQAVISGATGIQYFIRNGLNSFPKSTAAWGECGKLAMEINSLSPWLLSDETAVPVRSASPGIRVTSRKLRGQLVIMAVNTINEPVRSDIIISRNINGRAYVLFENRHVRISGGIISDYIAAYGSQAYRIDIEPFPDPVSRWKNNLVTDPGFEDISSPGIPSACYARTGGDRGATYFTDPVVRIEGNNSLRLITPVQDKSVTLRFFPVVVSRGTRYLVSVRARSDPERRFTINDAEGEKGPPGSLVPQYVEIGMGEFGMSRFVPTSEWKQYVASVTIPHDTLPQIKANVILRMPGQGVAWFDLLEVIEDPLKILNSEVHSP